MDAYNMEIEYRVTVEKIEKGTDTAYPNLTVMCHVNVTKKEAEMLVDFLTKDNK